MLGIDTGRVPKAKRVLLLPGWFGRATMKYFYLRTWGFDVCRPQMSDWLFGRAVSQAQETHDKFKPDVIVGNSRGGAIAMSLKTNAPLILFAPAWKFFGVPPVISTPATIIHSPNDETILFEDSKELARCNPGVGLIATGVKHTLNCKGAIDAFFDAMNKYAGPIRQPIPFPKGGLPGLMPIEGPRG